MDCIDIDLQDRRSGDQGSLVRRRKTIPKRGVPTIAPQTIAVMTLHTAIRVLPAPSHIINPVATATKHSHATLGMTSKTQGLNPAADPASAQLAGSAISDTRTGSASTATQLARDRSAPQNTEPARANGPK